VGRPYGVTKGLMPKFGRDRVLDTPITKSAFIGAAIGAAATGLRPIADLSFVDFMGGCFDQIFNQAAKFRYMFGGKAVTPVVIRTMYGAGFLAASQHSQWRARWTLQLLEEKVVELNIVERASDNTIGRTLKKTRSNLI
jgi:pyruvate/2-oxoglutarate/acetoin dehydrogenase E1 component